jgi:hypothetical protein
MVQGKRFTKIKDKGTKLEIRWEQPVGGNYDANQCDLKSAISPHPDFRSAMQDLVTYWQQMLDLDERYAQDVKLHSLQISWKDRQISGAILTGALLLPARPFLLVLMRRSARSARKPLYTSKGRTGKRTCSTTRTRGRLSRPKRRSKRLPRPNSNRPTPNAIFRLRRAHGVEVSLAIPLTPFSRSGLSLTVRQLFNSTARHAITSD